MKICRDCEKLKRELDACEKCAGSAECDYCKTVQTRINLCCGGTEETPVDPSTLTIEKGIPIPRPTHTSRYRETFEKMEVGDSVLIPTTTQGNFAHATRHLKKTRGYTFTSRKEGNGFRLWRTH